MDIQDLFLSCRSGDLPRVECLVEQKEVDLNIRDKWDSTPLYYACLCGHVDVVKFLLERGARCEANSFDGERCVYGALSDEIRNLLRSFKVVTSQTIRRDTYHEFLRRTLDHGPYSDIKFVVKGVEFRAHRCILAVRSDFFADMLETRWKEREVVTITHRLVEPHAFGAILQFIYTARLETPVDQLEDVLRLAKYCRLDHLMEQLETRLKRVFDFASTKPGVHVKTVCIEPTLDSTELQEDLAVLVDRAIPPGFYTQLDVDLPFTPELEQTSPDVIFSVEKRRFFCHNVFFCERSEYFKTLVEDRFTESTLVDTDQWGPLPELTLHDISAEIFGQILSYVYTDTAELSQDNVWEVLQFADLYLLKGLTRICALVIGQDLDTENVVSALQAARLFDIPRLETQCSEFMANSIEKMLCSEEFKDFVLRDAETVKDRQEVDSIPIIDDIRFHITNRLQTMSDMYEAEQKLAVIDEYLAALCLEG